MELTLTLPDRYLADQEPSELARRIRLYAAVLMFRARELSSGAASELAGVDRLTFAAECQRHGVPLIDYSAAELRAELDALSREG